jgi:hypothetical protein
MKTIKSYIGALAAASLLLVTGAVSAAPIQGDVTFFGAWQAKALDGTTNATIDSAAHIAFGDANVSQAIGDFAGAKDVPVQYKSFTFNPFVGPIAPLWTFQVGTTTFSFTLENITVGMQTATQLALIGTGTAFGTGFDATPFNWTFSGDSTGALLSFSASAFNAVGVPEPSVIGLLGLGLIGIGAVRVRRRYATLKA